jgi:Flp pilus assembly pilin Flp
MIKIFIDYILEKLRDKKGQSMIEYVLIITVITIIIIILVIYFAPLIRNRTLDTTTCISNNIMV